MSMRTIRKLAVLATTAATLTMTVPAAAATKGSIEKKEDALAAAGFEPKPANTPERQQMLARLPADKFSQRVTGDATMYVYADPKVCNCLYVGDQTAYAAYQRQAQAKQIADEQQEAAQDYQDAQWDWGAWGPWGPRWGHFGFGLHRGW
jgi:Tfp pilus assembly PilM family ATPase